MIFPKSKLILAFIMASALALMGACGGADPATPATPVPAATSAPPQTSSVETASAGIPATPAPAATSAPAQRAPVAAATSTPVPPTPFPTAVATRLDVITTTALVADWAANVGGDRVDVTSLVPRNVDPHTFNPGARDIARVAEADVVFGIGLTLEDGWLVDLIRNAAPEPDTFVPLGDIVDPIEFGGDMHGDHDDHDDHDEDHEDHEDEHDHEGEDHDEDHEDHEDEHDHEGEDHDEDHEDHEDDHEGEDHDEDHEHEEDEHDHEGEDHDEDHEDEEDEHDHEGEDHDEHEGDEHEGHDDHHDHAHGEFDPHFWFDPIRVGAAVDGIAARLSALDAANADFYAANAAAYNAELVQVDGWVKARVAEIPAVDRKLATSHDAFRYYALRYGFEIVGTVIPGGGTEVEPSAQEVAALIDRIRDESIKAVFTETTVSDRLTRRVAEEGGAKIINDLYSGGMSEAGGDAGTYLDFMRYNTTVIVDALK